MTLKWKNLKRRVSNSVFYHDAAGKNHRIQKGSRIPNGFVKGRYFKSNPGLDSMNSRKAVINLMTRSVERVIIVNDKIHARQSAISPENTVLYFYSGMIYTSRVRLVKAASKDRIFLRGLEKHDIPSELNSWVVNFSKGNNKFNGIKELWKRDFLIRNIGKTLNDLGITYCYLKDYVYDGKAVPDWN